MEHIKYDVFISYSRKDYFDEQNNVIQGNEISKILQALTDAGISYWIDKEGIGYDDYFRKKIIQNIKASRIFLFLSTYNSNNTDWIAIETIYASELGKYIIPIRIDNSVYSDKIMPRIILLESIKYYEKPEQKRSDLIDTIRGQLEVIKREEEEEVKKAQIERVERKESREDNYGQPLQYEVSNPMVSCPREDCPNCSNYGGTGSFVDRVNDFFKERIAAAASYLGRIIKSTIDKTNVSYSALTNDIPKTGNVFSSIFAPAEVKRSSHMLVQVYLHLPEETEKVQTFAREADKDAERRDYIPLQCKLRKGDSVGVLMSIYGESILMSEKKSVVWQGSFIKCSFDYFVPKDLDVEELSCMAMLTVNGIPAGEMRFITKVVENPRQLNPKIFSRQYQKIFISYAHQDEPKVEQMARAYKAQGVEYFFDRHYLQPGDIFPMKIREFIDSADLFILCWSANAANSDYVDLERKRALERAYPKIKPIEKAPLRIYPMSIEPRAELPADMRDTYNFEII